MIYITIYEESMKRIKGKCEIKVLREGVRAINGKKVGSADNRIKMNHRNTVVITRKFWLYNPKTRLRIRFITAKDQPVDKRTRIIYSVKRERKKKQNSCNGHSSHTWQFSICLNKNGITPGIAPLPARS